VARGYALGINAALDLYLARNELETQRAAVQQERQRQMERVVELQTILGQPPSGALAVTPTLPEWDSQPEILQPVSALNHRADIEQAWLQWIAGDARRAAAYKARLPQLQLSANLGYSDNSISDLLEGGLWSLAANFSQPLFNAGQLRARYQRTQVQMQALQQDYLAAVDRALGEVEIALSRAEKLQASLGALEKAEHSAAEALKLSITLYERGLVSYTTVLESQQRAFDSALTTIDARNTIAQNRVALYLALGGQFYSSATQLTL
jgi:outer membrane protein TolC